jgi:hypothetical protein
VSVDLVLAGGTLLTQVAEAPRAEALAVRDGRIVAVGSRDQILALAGPTTRHIDLGGRTLIPGFNDAHAHVWKIGHLLTTMVDLRRASAFGEVAAALAEADWRQAGHGWLLARGLNEARLAEGRLPDRRDLDAMLPHRPVAITRTCGHIIVANSRALLKAGVTAGTPDPPGGVVQRDAGGEPTGVLHETAMGLVTGAAPAPGDADYRRMILAALGHQLSLGITSTSDCGVGPALLETYVRMDEERQLPARVNVMPLRRVDGVPRPVPLPRRRVTSMLRVDTVKFLADGGLSGATAALGQPYRHVESTGVLRFRRDELLELARESQEAGWRIATHAIGDAAIDLVLDVYEALGPIAARRAHRIEHLGLPSGAQLARAAACGVVAVPQTVFLYSLGRNFRECLPDALLARAYPVRAMREAGLVVALSSDAPVVEDDNPLLGIRSAVLRRDETGQPIAPGEAISTTAALEAYTRGGALATGDAPHLGLLREGHWADLAVLSGNPLDCDAAALTDLRVEMTFVAGVCRYER